MYECNVIIAIKMKKKGREIGLSSVRDESTGKFVLFSSDKLFSRYSVPVALVCHCWGAVSLCVFRCSVLYAGYVGSEESQR